MRVQKKWRLPLPLALVGLAVVLGWMGLHYVFSSTPTPPVPNNPSNISVYTSDPKAAVDLRLFPAYNSAKDTLPGFQWVDFNFRIQAENGSVWWALALGGDAAPPPGELPDSGRLPTPSGEPDDTCCHEVPVGRTYFYNPSTTAIEAPAFVTRVNWPPLGEDEEEDEEEDYEATIIYGHHPEGGDFAVSLAVKVRKPLMQDNGGEYVTISSPRLGWTNNEPPMEWKGLPVSQRLSDLEDGESRQGDVASLEDPGWYKPKRMQARLAVSDLVGTRQESGTPPVAPFKPEWEAKNSLKVDAVLSRPTKAAENQRRIFLAGVFVSLAASFLVWAAELVVGPRREPVAARQRRPRKSDP